MRNVVNIQRVLRRGCAALAVVLASTAPAAEECELIGQMPDSLPAERPPSRVRFAPGEYLEFSVQYGLVNAGTATMQIHPKIRMRDGIPTYHFVTTAKSNKVFSTFFPVNDRVESFMDTLHLRSVRFEKHLREGKYRKDLFVMFDHERTLDLEPGARFYVPNHDNGKNYPMEVKVHGRETVTVDAGTFDCLVLEPVVLGEALFNQKGRLRVWVTDDEVKMPVLMKSKVLVGAIAAVLTEYRLGDGRENAAILQGGRR